MKNLITFVSVILSLLAIYSANAATMQHKPHLDSTSILVINGKVFFSESENPEDFESDCRIDVLKSNTIVDSLILKPGKKKFHIVLKKDSYYTIRITKKGYAEKLICVNTLFDGEDGVLYRLDFGTELITADEARHFDQDNLDFPAAILYYDKRTDSFEYSEHYTRSLRNDLFTSIAAQ
jgi:hypothetical protein